MRNILSTPGSAMRDIEPGAIRPWRFANLARHVATLAGRPAAFAIAVLAMLLWAASGPFFAFSDTWQLVINTSTTIITFLMVFIIQNTQNRDTAAIQIKLDELIRARKARTTPSSTWSSSTRSSSSAIWNATKSSPPPRAAASKRAASTPAPRKSSLK